MPHLNVIAIGSVFGKLTVIGPPIRKRTVTDRPDLWYPCLCECGTSKDIMGRLLRNRGNTSCGCKLRKGTSGAITYTRQAPEYHSWRSMKARCLNQNDPGFQRYGGRGIKIFPDWIDSYSTFLRDVGRRPSPEHSLDRFPDKNGNYEPGNVRWATMIEQNRNKRSNRVITFNGETKSLADWADSLGWPRGLLYQRIQKGFSVERALSQARTPKPTGRRRGPIVDA